MHDFAFDQAPGGGAIGCAMIGSAKALSCHLVVGTREEDDFDGVGAVMPVFQGRARPSSRRFPVVSLRRLGDFPGDAQYVSGFAVAGFLKFG